MKKDEIKTKVNNAVEWCKDHPVETIIIASVGVSMVSNVSRNLRRRQITRTERIKARQIYDPHTGMTWKVKRPLTNEEKVFLVNNARRGYDYHNSLMYLDLLPKK